MNISIKDVEQSLTEALLCSEWLAGFKYVRSAALFRKNTDYGWISYQLQLAKRPWGIAVSGAPAVRHDVVERIHGDFTRTSRPGAWKLWGTYGLGIFLSLTIEQSSDVTNAERTILEDLQARATPFFARFRERREILYGILDQAEKNGGILVCEVMRAAIIAALEGDRPRFDKVLPYCDRRERWLPGERESCYELFDHLKKEFLAGGTV